MESIIRDNLVQHMIDNKFFYDEQHGFVPGTSCITQLLCCMKDWTMLRGHDINVLPKRLRLSPTLKTNCEIKRIWDIRSSTEVDGRFFMGRKQKGGHEKLMSRMVKCHQRYPPRCPWTKPSRYIHQQHSKWH